MASTHGALLLSLLMASTSAIKVYSDYGGDHALSGYKEASDESQGGHWAGAGADHIGQEQDRLLHQHHFHSGAGGQSESGRNTGGHIKQSVTKGYQDYHHKNEVGKTTHFVDSYGDSGDHYGSHNAEAGWEHGSEGGHLRDHQVSGFAGQKSSTEKKSSQKKASSKKKEEYKGNIADIIYAKKPDYAPKQYQTYEYLHRYPQPYFY